MIWLTIYANIKGQFLYFQMLDTNYAITRLNPTFRGEEEEYVFAYIILKCASFLGGKLKQNKKNKNTASGQE